MKSATDGMNLLGFSTNTNKSSANWDASKVPANFIHSSRQADGPKRLHLSDSNRKSEISKFYLQVITHLHTDVTCIIHDTIFIDVPTLSKRWGGGGGKKNSVGWESIKKMENFFFFFVNERRSEQKKKTISKNKNKNRSRDEYQSLFVVPARRRRFFYLFYILVLKEENLFSWFETFFCSFIFCCCILRLYIHIIIIIFLYNNSLRLFITYFVDDYIIFTERGPPYHVQSS